MYSAEQIAQALDFAVLRPTATAQDIRVACEMVIVNSIRTICVAPIYTELATKCGAPVCTVIGFPHGTTLPKQKIIEAQDAISDGACELDVVINYGQLLDGCGVPVERELSKIVQFANHADVKVKAILETCYYTTSALDMATRFCADLGVDFIKTSTGYGLQGATPQAVKTILKALKGYDTQVKASGGIKTYNDATKYLALGCTRLGASRYEELLP